MLIENSYACVTLIQNYSVVPRQCTYRVSSSLPVAIADLPCFTSGFRKEHDVSEITCDRNTEWLDIYYV